MASINITVSSQTRFVKLRLGFRKTLAGDFIPTSDFVTIELDNTCANQSTYLTWLNSLGAWEYYDFTARKDYNIEFDGSRQLDKNLLPVWARDDTDKGRERFYSKINARKSYTVRAENLTQDEVDALAKIKHSIQVERIFANGDKETVLVDKSDFTIRKDAQKLHSLSFDMTESTEIPVQRQ